MFHGPGNGNKLFEYERQSHEKGHSHEQRKEYRIQKEMPLLDAFWEWVSQQSPKKGTRFEKADDFYKEIENEKKAQTFSDAIGVELEHGKEMFLDLFLYTHG